MKTRQETTVRIVIDLTLEEALELENAVNHVASRPSCPEIFMKLSSQLEELELSE